MYKFSQCIKQIIITPFLGIPVGIIDDYASMHDINNQDYGIMLIFWILVEHSIEVCVYMLEKSFYCLSMEYIFNQDMIPFCFLKLTWYSIIQEKIIGYI